jgi:hypothetical protein
MTPDQASPPIRDKRGRLLHGRPPWRQEPRAQSPPAVLKTKPSRKLESIWNPGDIAVATTAARRKGKISPPTHDEIRATIPPPIRPLTITTKEARAALAIGNSLLWKLIMSGRLETVFIGAKRLVLVSSLEKLVAEQLAKGNE